MQSNPHHIFTFSENDGDEIGGVWFIAKLGGFKASELGMFSDMIYRYLDKHYSDEFYVNPNYCIAVDVINSSEVKYQDLIDGKVSILIDNTISDINNLIK